MKASKSGFTLIELMVVISIIALLSSIVLGSLKSASEKAQITKTVGEMKSLQTAIELYRNQFGVYPGTPGSGYLDDDANNNGLINYSANNFNTFIQTNFINNKYLSKIPHAPNYPNNCGTTDCLTKGYFLGYLVQNNPFDPEDTFICGNEKFKNYSIIFMANNKKINLPTLRYYLEGSYIPLNGDLNENPPYFYCLSM